MALDWRTKRKALYLGIPLALISFIVLFFGIRSYATPSCTDGRMNGDEKGIDCEGSCPTICEERIKPLLVEWTSFEESTEGVFNAVGIIKNQNKDLVAKDVPYVLTVWNGTKSLAVEKGSVTVPSEQSVTVFRSGLKTGVEPTRITLKLLPPLSWEKTVSPRIDFVDARFSDTDSSPKLSVEMKNVTNEDISSAEVVVALIDGQGNADHISRTIIPSINRRSSATAYYTWNEPFSKNDNTCSEPFTAVMLIDRSGSMNEDSIDPPQPLTQVKESAEQFIRSVGKSGQMGLVSFATSPSLESEITNNYNKLVNTLGSVSIKPEDENGYTNIGDALEMSTKQLSSHQGQRYTILLTDGKPNWPKLPTGEEYAIQKGNDLRSVGISLLAIGLGNGIDHNTLSRIAGDPSNVYLAPTSLELDEIYRSISTRLCARSPYRVEVYPNVLYGEK